ncbi:single-stranded DNA-binding protein [Planomonospora sphaerica]|uniref:Single-stranded DNA-binding protein n=1 Tax=Planomonospora sphaerica TaxID=161355 RepID=A0A171DH07_9ACTN|nr:single-stranded DNA-binding protein [Planomonospora sphaerica]GAT68433.1 single-stranded DNA-binding protein [Planomonospora sphaerica]
MDRNEVVLAGRLPETVQVRSLQSGTRFGTWRLVVRRRQQQGRGIRVDTIPCVAFEPGVVETVTGWSPDDMVEVVGSLRRRWWGKDGAKASGYEVEVRSVRRLEHQPPEACDQHESVSAGAAPARS